MKQIYADRSPEISAREQANLDLVRSRAGECMVLLENDGALPLATPCKVALFGAGARGTIKGGTGSADTNSRFVVNVEQGLEQAGFTVVSKAWLDAQDAVRKQEADDYAVARAERLKNDLFGAVMDALKNPLLPTAEAPITEETLRQSQADLAIYVLARLSGEHTDRKNIPGDYQLTETELENIRTIGENYNKTIVLLNVGGVINAASIKETKGINALLLMSQVGNVSGLVVADVLLGKTIPSGRLSDTWARAYSDYPSSAGFSHNNGNYDEEYYTEGIYVGYRYFDTFNVTPLYPFGYGKNYTSFTMMTKKVTVDAKKITVTVFVTNSGSIFSGREVVQVYASVPEGRLEKPWQTLIGFGKTKLLAPGESETLAITMSLSNLESYDEAKAAYVLEAGSYLIRVGCSSRDTHIAAELVLDGEVVTKQVRNILPLQDGSSVPMAGDLAYDSGELHEISRKGVQPFRYAEEEAEKTATPKICLHADDVKTQVICYDHNDSSLPETATETPITADEVRSGKYTVEQLVSQLTTEEMAMLCVGTSRMGEEGASVTNVVGAASDSVPGAAGETTGYLAYRNIRKMILADGGAGLRLTPHFRVDKDGNLLPGGSAVGGVGEGFGETVEGGVDYYQYCTATPIATLLCSSWDPELVEAMGSVIGEELLHFGCHVILGPAANIHRNPLCGRNFEYFSEDPLLSGLMSAAQTRGVQKHPGAGVCVKHFFANNQEENRFFVNEHVSEQALREIYLRNFGIAVEAGQPMTIMSSYNLVNGVHTANSFDALTDFLRKECGFRGYVMTDWFTSNDMMCKTLTTDRTTPKYISTSSRGCILAGNDLQEPGSRENVDDIVAAVRDETLPLRRLQDCAVRILKVLFASTAYENAKPYAMGKDCVSFVHTETV